MSRKAEHKTNCVCVHCQAARTVRFTPETRREYVSHDPHTVALLKPDALKRLEGWMGAKSGAVWMSYNPSLKRQPWWVNLWDKGDRAGAGGKTLSAAIHAALDQAETR